MSKPMLPRHAKSRLQLGRPRSPRRRGQRSCAHRPMHRYKSRLFDPGEATPSLSFGCPTHGSGPERDGTYKRLHTLAKSRRPDAGLVTNLLSAPG